MPGNFRAFFFNTAMSDVIADNAIGDVCLSRSASDFQIMLRLLCY
jgi:hypothetical protein